MKFDYIVVGLGLAGVAFTRILEKNNKSFIVFEDNSQHSSKVAGGMYNPIILKRFTPVWDAERQLKVALPYFKELEDLLGNTYDFSVDIYRLFTSIEEQNNWFAACDNPILSGYMIPKIVNDNHNGISSPFGFGKVIKTGRIATAKLLIDYNAYLKVQRKIISNKFDYSKIQFKDDSIVYENIEATKIIFCEGFGLKKNPYFKNLPMQEAKGELLTIFAPKLKIDFVLKTAVFIMPMGDNLFKVGATFNWKDKTSLPTEEGKKELVDKLNKILQVPYEIVDHHAGIRPTVKDRRPLVGVHSKHHQLGIINGLGTRGVMIAPTAAQELYNHIENREELRREININRFEK